MDEKACALIGLRPSELPIRVDEPAIFCLLSAMEHAVRRALDDGFRIFYSGGTLGCSLWFAEIVLRLRDETPGVRLRFLLPCETQANNWPEAWRERYFELLAAADDVRYISHRFTPACVRQRNEQLVASARRLIAVCDDRQSGSVPYTIQHSRQTGREVEVVWLE